MRRGGGNQVFTVAWEEAKTFSPPPPPSDSGKSFGHTCREQHRMGGRGPGLGMKEPRVSPRHQWRDSELEGAREEPV